LRVIVSATSGSAVAGNVPKLRVVENIEGFATELEPDALGDLEVLEERHVKVRAMRIAQEVSSRIAEGQAARWSKGGLIVECGAECIERNLSEPSIGIADQVGVRRRPDAVAYAGVIRRKDDTERTSGLETGDTGILPSSEDFVRQSRRLEEGHIPDITDVEDMPLIEVGTGAVAGGVIRVNKASIEAVRRVVDGVAVGIGDAELQTAKVAAYGGLKRVVDRGCGKVQVGNVA